MTSQLTTTKSAGQTIVAYFKDFGVLKETGTEYWGIQIVNFLDCTFYFAMLTIATVFLSEDLGLNDKQAGYSVALFTSATSLMLFVSGLYTDWLGIRKSLYLLDGRDAGPAAGRGGGRVGPHPAPPRTAGQRLVPLDGPLHGRHPDRLPVLVPAIYNQTLAQRRFQSLVPFYEHRRGRGRIQH